jgi:cytochrome d ubiquinol oxidase subunit II
MVTTLWFILVAFMLAVYVVLDGFDLGAGVLHLFIAHGDGERRVVLRSIGPVWDGNEVWLIAAGGTLFFAFPMLYSSSFSGFYLPLIIVLWLLMGRGVSIELRSRLNNPIWSTFWDGIFSVSSALLVIFYGAALANVVRGVPFSGHGYFFEALWTNFDPKSSNPGILDWYTILIGLLALAALTVHGATYVAMKTEGAVHDAALRAVLRPWVATVALTALGTIATFWLRSSMASRFGDQPWGAVFPVLALCGLVGVPYFTRNGREVAAFLSSGAYLAGMLAATAFALYPDVLPGVVKADSLTIYNASASDYGLKVGLVWWLIGIVLALIYVVVAYRLFRGKVSEAASTAH